MHQWPNGKANPWKYIYFIYKSSYSSYRKKIVYIRNDILVRNFIKNVLVVQHGRTLGWSPKCHWFKSSQGHHKQHAQVPKWLNGSDCKPEVCRFDSCLVLHIKNNTHHLKLYFEYLETYNLNYKDISIDDMAKFVIYFKNPNQTIDIIPSNNTIESKRRAKTINILVWLTILKYNSKKGIKWIH